MPDVASPGSASYAQSGLQVPMYVPTRTDAYDVGPLDVITFRVFNLEKVREISTFDVEVDAEGYINLPYVGPLLVSGKSLAELRQLAVSRYAENYLQKPELTVTMHDYRSRPITVLGAVEKGGVFYLQKNDVTLTEALSLAGGLSTGGIDRVHAGTTALVVSPPTQKGGVPVRTEVNLVDLLLNGNQQLNMTIGPHTTVDVLPSEDIYVQGYVAKPGSFPYYRPITVTQAVGLAGGVDETRGSPEVCEVRRATSNGVERIKVDLTAIASGETADVPIRPKDTVWIGRTWFKAFVEFINNVASHFGFGATV
jgi:polysaccharide export outer membrane protein